MARCSGRERSLIVDALGRFAPGIHSSERPRTMQNIPRIHTLNRIVHLCGGAIEIIDPARAWPALVDIQLPGGICPAALHVGPVGQSGRGRQAVERRFQNPGKGKPIVAPGGVLPLLIGLWSEQADEGTPVLVGMDATCRIGDETRKSLFVSLAVLRAAQASGWEEHTSTSGERIIAFAPALLPRYIAVRLQEWAPALRIAA